MTIRFIKNCIAEAALLAGVLKLLRNHLAKQSAPILMYHRILPGVEGRRVHIQPGMYVSLASFEMQVSLLKNHFDIVPLETILSKLKKQQAISGLCALTFDDGWLDNYTHAFPILKKYDVPATIFLATAFTNTDRIFWPEEILLFLTSTNIQEHSHHCPALRKLASEVPQVSLPSEMFLDKCIDRLKVWKKEDRLEILTYYRSVFLKPPIKRSLLNWQEVKEMQDSGLVDFGAHTANHVILDKVSAETAQKEIVDSLDAIRSYSGKKPKLFAYPNGNFNPLLQKLVLENGFSGACSTEKNWCSNSSDLFALPRIGIHEDIGKTEARFLSRLLLRGF